MKALGLLLLLGSVAGLLRTGEPELRLQARTAVDDGDFSRSLSLYKEALDREPASPYRWADLAEAYSLSGDIPNAERSFARARRLGPHIPPIWIRDANFHFGRGEPAAALVAGTGVLATVPDYDGLLFTYFDRLIGDTKQVLSAIGSDRRSTVAYFEHLLKTNDVKSAQIAWSDVSSRNFVDDELAGTYISFLLRNQRYDEARESWSTFLGPRCGDYPDRNLLFNGSFEKEPTSSPFDWTIQVSDRFDTSRDKSNAKDGAWSVHVTFHGDANVSYDNVRQTARVRPGPYHLRAWIRTQDVTTNEGIRLRLVDAEKAARFDFRTDPILGSRGWFLIVELIKIPTETNLVTLEVFREPSAKFDNKISGSAWIDQISLTRDPR